MITSSFLLLLSCSRMMSQHNMTLKLLEILIFLNNCIINNVMIYLSYDIGQGKVPKKGLTPSLLNL